MQQRRSQDLYPGQGEGPGNEVGNAAITIQEILSTGEFGGNMGLFLGCSILHGLVPWMQYTDALRVHRFSVGSCDFPQQKKFRGNKREPRSRQ